MTNEECEKIAALYSNGKSFGQITVLTGRTAPAIRRALLVREVSVRPLPCKLSHEQRDEILRRYQQGESSSELASEFKISRVRVCQLTRAQGLSRTMRDAKPPLSCREDFFDVIDTERKAYWLGFIAADGCVSTSIDGKQIRTRLSISLANQDVEHLRIFLRDVRSSVKIGQRGPACRGFALTCDRMTSALIGHGIVRRKSLRLRFPTSVPQHLIRHFIRGYFDGDGCVYVNAHKRSMMSVSLIGTPRFLERAQREISAVTAPARGCLSLLKNRNKATAQLLFGGRRSVAAIERYFYRGARIFLLRKREKFSRA